MDGTGEHSERPRVHAFSHMWKTDLNTNISTILYTYKSEHVSKSGALRGDWGGKEEKSHTEWVILKYITSV
jgi:hypothetical protein